MFQILSLIIHNCVWTNLLLLIASREKEITRRETTLYTVFYRKPLHSLHVHVPRLEFSVNKSEEKLVFHWFDHSQVHDHVKDVKYKLYPINAIFYNVNIVQWLMRTQRLLILKVNP